MSNGAVVGLADGIDALRAELMDAAARGWDQEMKFSMEPVELTVQVAVTRDVNGKIGWNIFEIGGKYEQVGTQTLTLKLTPLWKQEDGSFTSDFSIASSASSEDTVGPHK